MPGRGPFPVDGHGFELEEANSEVDGFRNSRVSSTVSTHNVPVLSSLEPSRPLKRRRTAGMNSRFDNMIEQVNLMQRLPVAAPRRRRAPTPKPSSRARHDTAEAPLDAYRHLHGGQVGKDFTLIKAADPDKGRAFKPFEFKPTAQNASPEYQQDDQTQVEVRPKTPDPIPDWLNGTLSRLHPGHPLRSALSVSGEAPHPAAHRQRAAGTTNDSQQHSLEQDEEQIFSFQIPDMYNTPFWTGSAHHEQTEAASSDTLYAPESGPESTLFSPTLPVRVEESPSFDFRAYASIETRTQENPYTAIPFSTPGPGKSNEYTRSDVPIKPANAFSNLILSPTALSTASLTTSAHMKPLPSAFQRVDSHPAPKLSSISSSVPRSPGPDLFRKPSIPRETSYDIDNPFPLAHMAHAYPSASDRQSAHTHARSHARSGLSFASPTLLNAAEPLQFRSPTPLLAQQSNYGVSTAILQALDTRASLSTPGELPEDEESDVFAFSLPLPTGSHMTAAAGQGPAKNVEGGLQDLPPSDETFLPEYESLEPYDSPLKRRSLSGLFSKPGPTYGVYFDSPTEDPSSSPLSSPHAYPLDVEELDFRWAPFVRGNQKANMATSPRIQQSDDRAYSPMQHSSEPNAETAAASSFRSMPTLVLNDNEDEDVDEEVNGDWEVSIRSHAQPPPSSLPAPEPDDVEDEDALAFAPAPGIFVSPLRDGPEDEAIESTAETAPFPAPSPPANKDVAFPEDDVPTWTVLETAPAVGFCLNGSPPRTPPRRAVPISVMNARLVKRGSGLPDDERYEKDSIESWTPGERGG